jgi:hypothetical protein
VQDTVHVAYTARHLPRGAVPGRHERIDWPVALPSSSSLVPGRDDDFNGGILARE